MATLTAASNYLENALLNHAFRNVTYTPPSAIYVGLFTTAPSDAGGGTEVGTRQAAAFGSAAARASATTADITFTAVPAGTVTHVALFDAASAGNMLFWGEVDTPVDPGGDDLVIASGTLTITIAAGFMTDYLANELLDHTLRSESYSPAATVEMALLDDADAEVGVSRQSVTFAAASAGQSSNSAGFEFTGLPAFTWAAGRLHEDAAGGGQALWEWAVTPKPLAAGSALTFAVGSAVVGLD